MKYDMISYTIDIIYDMICRMIHTVWCYMIYDLIHDMKYYIQHKYHRSITWYLYDLVWYIIWFTGCPKKNDIHFPIIHGENSL